MLADYIPAAVTIVTAVAAWLTATSTNRSKVVEGYDSLVGRLEARLAASRIAEAAIQARVTALEQAQESDAKTIRAQAERIEALEGELRTAAGRIKTATQEAEFRQTELEQYREMVREHEVTIGAQRSRIVDLEQRVASLESRLQAEGIDPDDVNGQPI